MVPQLYLRDVRNRLRDAFAAWAVLTASAVVLMLVTAPIAIWTGRDEWAIALALVLVGPVATYSLWQSLSYGWLPQTASERSARRPILQPFPYITTMACLREQLSSSFRASEVALQLPSGPAAIEFTRDEFLNLYQVHDQVAEILLKAFVEPRVMHSDLGQEDVERSIEGLTKIGGFLQAKTQELRSNLPESQSGLIRIIDMYSYECFNYARTIRHYSSEMGEGRGEFDSGFPVLLSDWHSHIHRQFRLAVYPLVRTLIDTLPEDDPARREALTVWYQGRKLLHEEQKDQTLPQWRVVWKDGTA